MFITSGPDQRHVYHKEWNLSVSLQEVREYDQEYHNHILQINPRHREGVELHKTMTVTRYPRDNKIKANSSLFLVKRISKLEKLNC